MSARANTRIHPLSPDNASTHRFPTSALEAYALRAAEHSKRLTHSIDIPPPDTSAFIVNAPNFLFGQNNQDLCSNKPIAPITVRRLVFSYLLSQENSRWLRSVLNHEKTPEGNVDLRLISGKGLLRLTNPNISEQDKIRLIALIASVSAGLDAIQAPYPIPPKLAALKAAWQKTALPNATTQQENGATQPSSPACRTKGTGLLPHIRRFLHGTMSVPPPFAPA